MNLSGMIEISEVELIANSKMAKNFALNFFSIGIIMNDPTISEIAYTVLIIVRIWPS
jgi:hypothetical protein